MIGHALVTLPLHNRARKHRHEWTMHDMKTNTFKMLTSAFALASAVSASAPCVAGEGKPEPEDCTRRISAGKASWYGEEVAIGHDKKGNLIYNPTASGEPFNPNRLTAAFPDEDYLGDYLLVTRGKEELIVYVNDIGPSRKNPKTKHRVIDLARASAEQLGIVGLSNVQVYACDL